MMKISDYENFLIVILFTIFIISCNLKGLKSNEQIISEITQNLEKKEHEYALITGIIQPIRNGYIDLFGKDNRISTPKNISKKEKNKLKKFMIENNYDFIKIKEQEKILFIDYGYHNKNDDLCYLICYLPIDMDYQKLYPNFEIIKGDERPTRNGGWIYIINPQWIIYSPHKTNKKDDTYIQLFLFVIMSFIIMKVLKKRK